MGRVLRHRRERKVREMTGGIRVRATGTEPKPLQAAAVKGRGGKCCNQTRAEAQAERKRA